MFVCIDYNFANLKNIIVNFSFLLSHTLGGESKTIKHNIPD